MALHWPHVTDISGFHLRAQGLGEEMSTRLCSVMHFTFFLILFAGRPTTTTETRTSKTGTDSSLSVSVRNGFSRIGVDSKGVG